MTKEVWVVVGQTSGNVAGQAAGLTEYQFSDGPPGERGSSTDYLSLEQGMLDHTGWVIHFVPLN